MPEVVASRVSYLWDIVVLSAIRPMDDRVAAKVATAHGNGDGGHDAAHGEACIE
jgi:hypothetical protein